MICKGGGVRPGRSFVPAALATLVLLGACSLGDDDDGDDDDAAAGDSECPVEPALVAELLGYAVEVDDATSNSMSCRFDPTDPEAHPGAHVIVVERPLADDGYAAVLDAVEESSGPTDELPDGAVDGADRGWVARLGRVAQVGAARENALVQVTVADAELDVSAAEDVAQRLAEEALG